MKLPLKFLVLIHDNFPQTVDESEADGAYRDALESMSLSLLQSGVSDDIILEAIQTASDAYGNNK